MGKHLGGVANESTHCCQIAICCDTSGHREGSHTSKRMGERRKYDMGRELRRIRSNS